MHTCTQRAFTLHISASPSSSYACPDILIKMLTTINIKQIFPKGHNATKQQTELSEVNSNHKKCCIINVTVHFIVVLGNVYSFYIIYGLDSVCVFSLGIQASNRPSHSNARIWSNYRILCLCLLIWVVCYKLTIPYRHFYGVNYFTANGQ